MKPPDPGNAKGQADDLTRCGELNYLQHTATQRQIKLEVFAHLKAWLQTGNAYSLRLAKSKVDSLAKEAR